MAECSDVIKKLKLKKIERLIIDEEICASCQREQEENLIEED